jgi:hypothetical protein
MSLRCSTTIRSPQKANTAEQPSKRRKSNQHPKNGRDVVADLAKVKGRLQSLLRRILKGKAEMEVEGGVHHCVQQRVHHQEGAGALEQPLMYKNSSSTPARGEAAAGELQHQRTGGGRKGSSGV